MNWSLRISEAAFEDIGQAKNWYDEQLSGLSHEFENSIEYSYDDILRSPEAYQVKYKSVRVKYISRFPYGIHYFLEPKIVYVIAVFGTHENSSKWYMCKVLD